MLGSSGRQDAHRGTALGGRQHPQPLARPTTAAGNGSVPVLRVVFAAVIVALNGLDVLITMAVIGRGGHEVNPVARALLEHSDGFVPVKLALGVLVGALLILSPTSSRTAEWGGLAVVALYGPVVAWNLTQFLSRGG